MTVSGDLFVIGPATATARNAVAGIPAHLLAVEASMRAITFEDRMLDPDREAEHVAAMRFDAPTTFFGRPANVHDDRLHDLQDEVRHAGQITLIRTYLLPTPEPELNPYALDDDGDRGGAGPPGRPIRFASPRVRRDAAVPGAAPHSRATRTRGASPTRAS